MPSPTTPRPNFNTSTNSWTHHPKIAAVTKFGKRMWKVSGHLAGTRHYSKWERARDYALAEVLLVYEAGSCPNTHANSAGQTLITNCNCTGACQPRRVWKAVGY
jgi:hypothetical protein